MVEKMNILADYVYVVPRESKKRKTKTRFLFSIRPKDLNDDEDNSWLGTTAIVKATVEKNVNGAIKTLSERIGSLKSEVDGGYGKVSALEERISDL